MDHSLLLSRAKVMLDPDRTIARTSRAGGVGEEIIDATKATRTASEEKRAARTENQES